MFRLIQCTSLYCISNVLFCPVHSCNICKYGYVLTYQHQTGCPCYTSRDCLLEIAGQLQENIQPQAHQLCMMIFVIFTTTTRISLIRLHIYYYSTFVVPVTNYQLCAHSHNLAFHVKLDRHNLGNYVNTFSISYHTSNILSLMNHIVDMWPNFYETSQWSDCFMIWYVDVFLH